jgi:hypothetical protein
MVLPKSLFSDGVWPRIRTRLPASASRHPYSLWERELGSEACEPHSLHVLGHLPWFGPLRSPSFIPATDIKCRPCRAAVKDGRSFGGHPKGLSLYGAFEVKHLFHGILHFLPSSQFLCSTWNPVSSPRPTCVGRPARAGAVKAGRRSAVASCSIVSRPRLDSSEHGGTLVVVGMTIRGEPAFGRGSSRRKLVFGRSIRT